MEWLRDAARLRAFLAVAETGSFTAAAGRLGVTQPTVSTLVGALEERLGTPLLDRSRRGTRPTAAGVALLPHAGALLAEAEAAGRAVDRAVAPERRHLRIGGGEVLTTHVLPPALAALSGRLPGLEADVLAGDEPRVLAALESGRVELALVTDRAPVAGLDAEPFADDALVLLLPAGHPLAAKARLRPADLRGATLVVRDAAAVDRREVEAFLAARGAEPAARLVAGGAEAVRRCVASGLGVALVPGVAAAASRPEVTARPLTGAPRLRYLLARRRGHEVPLAAPLLEALRAAAGGSSKGSAGGSSKGVSRGPRKGAAGASSRSPSGGSSRS